MVSLELFIDIIWHNPFGRTMIIVSTQPLIEMRIRNISWWVKAAFMCRLFKSVSLKLLEHSVPVQARSRIALPFISFENTTLIFSWSDWLRTTWCTSAGMDRYPTEFHSEQLRSRVETRHRLRLKRRLHILKWRDIWKSVYCHDGVCEVPVPLRYDATSPDTLFIMGRDRLVDWKRREKTAQWHCVISQWNRIFMYVFRKREIQC
jgi:hypothetical protein